jgi:hypothetical protein
MNLLWQIASAGFLITIFIALCLFIQRRRRLMAGGSCALGACSTDCDRSGRSASKHHDYTHS